jgi:hypothetical protein
MRRWEKKGEKKKENVFTRQECEKTMGHIISFYGEVDAVVVV